MRLVQDVQRRAARSIGSTAAAAAASSSEIGAVDPVTPIAVAATRRDGASTAAVAGESLIAIVGDDTAPEAGTLNFKLQELQQRIDDAGIP